MLNDFDGVFASTILTLSIQYFFTSSKALLSFCKYLLAFSIQAVSVSSVPNIIVTSLVSKESISTFISTKLPLYIIFSLLVIYA